MTIYPSTSGTLGWAAATTVASNDNCVYYPKKTTSYANEYLNYPITYTPIINNNFEKTIYSPIKDYSYYTEKITNNLESKVWGNIYTKYGGLCETPTTCTYDYEKWVVISTPAMPPAQRLRAILASRSGPLLIGTRRALVPTSQEREMRARETLCRVIGEEKFRKFLRCGFVTVKAPSGLVYQIFPGHEMTRVWDKGKQIEKLCVVLRGDFPPTDTLIVRYLMILNNEQQFRALANKSIPYSTQSKPQAVDMRSLVDIWKELKVAA